MAPVRDFTGAGTVLPCGNRSWRKGNEIPRAMYLRGNREGGGRLGGVS